MVYWHGTTYTSGLDIMRSRRFSSVHRIWEDSSVDNVYFYKDEIDKEEHAGLRSVLENAQLSMAARNELSTQVAVVKLTVPDELEFEDDISAETMSYYSAVQIDRQELNRMIETGEIQMEVLFFPDVYVPGIRLFYLALVGDNILSNLTEFEKRIVKEIKRTGVDIYEEAMADPVWEAASKIA